jgi:hypothetical protein
VTKRRSRRRACRLLLALVSGSLVGGASGAEKSAQAHAVSFAIDAGRILFETNFQTPDGGARKALAFFNMGMAAPILSKPLYRELGIDRGQSLRFSAADVEFEFGADKVKDGDGGVAEPSFEQMFTPRHVEAMFPASALRDRVLILDYAHHAFAIERSGAKKPAGVAVPIALNPETGFAVIDVEIAGAVHAFVVDAGGGYSWMRGDILAEWLTAHPDWRRAEGSIGPANYNMMDFAFEKQGIVARLPEIGIGEVRLADVGVLGTGPILGSFADGLVGDLFWNNWQKSAPKPVVGWLGANVLKNFKLTIDYPNRMSYWKAQSAPDAHELDQPGVTLVRRDGRYFIGGLVRATKENQASAEPIEGVQIGDELLSVDDLDARSASKGELLATLHGKPNDIKILTLIHGDVTTKIETHVLDLR